MDNVVYHFPQERSGFGWKRICPKCHYAKGEAAFLMYSIAVESPGCTGCGAIPQSIESLWEMESAHNAAFSERQMKIHIAICELEDKKVRMLFESGDDFAGRLKTFPSIWAMGGMAYREMRRRYEEEKQLVLLFNGILVSQSHWPLGGPEVRSFPQCAIQEVRGNTILIEGGKDKYLPI